MDEKDPYDPNNRIMMNPGGLLKLIEIGYQVGWRARDKVALTCPCGCAKTTTHSVPVDTEAREAEVLRAGNAILSSMPERRVPVPLVKGESDGPPLLIDPRGKILVK